MGSTVSCGKPAIMDNICKYIEIFENVSLLLNSSNSTTLKAEYDGSIAFIVEIGDIKTNEWDYNKKKDISYKI